MFLRLAEHWPWAVHLARAFHQLRKFPHPESARALQLVPTKNDSETPTTAPGDPARHRPRHRHAASERPLNNTIPRSTAGILKEGATEERFWLLLVSSRRDQMPQLTTAVGVIRIIAPPPFPLSSIASASPLTWTQRGCHGGSTSSMTMQTF